MTTRKDDDQVVSLVPYDVRHSIGHADDYEVLIAALVVMRSWLDDDAKVERIRTGNGHDRRYRMTKTVRARIRVAIAIMHDISLLMREDARRNVAAIQRIDGDRP